MSYFTDHPESLPARAHQIMRDPQRRIEDSLSTGQMVVAADECIRALKTRRYANDRELRQLAVELAEAL